MIGNMVGAVEAESPAYIRKTFRNLDDLGGGIKGSQTTGAFEKILQPRPNGH